MKCHICQGKGEVGDKKCTNCEGSGYAPKNSADRLHPSRLQNAIDDYLPEDDFVSPFDTDYNFFSTDFDD